MAIVRDIIKRYLFEIICGVLAAAGIGLAFAGLSSMSEVQSGMQQAAELHSRLTSMARSSTPPNPAAIAAQQKRIERIQQTYQTAMAFARKLDEFQPLVPGAFPSASAADKKEFQRAYQAEVGSWLGKLQAGAEPTALMVDEEKVLMEAEEATRINLLNMSPQKAKSELSADVRAALRNAQHLYMYATADAFNQSAVSAVGGPMYSESPPGNADMWYAQLEIWIQRDIVDAIARINEAAAQKLEKKDRWVAHLPIKELDSIQLSSYYIGDSAGGGRGSESTRDRAYPPGTADNVFTKDKSNDLYEVLQFSIRMVVDARDLPTIIAGLCQDRFHTPLRVDYVKKEPSESWTGKIYGDEPLIEVTIDFETVMFSELYLPLMPDEILTVVNKQRPQPPGTEGT